jgi:hypothetical protein
VHEWCEGESVEIYSIYIGNIRLFFPHSNFVEQNGRVRRHLAADRDSFTIKLNSVPIMVARAPSIRRPFASAHEVDAIGYWDYLQDAFVLIHELETPLGHGDVIVMLNLFDEVTGRIAYRDWIGYSNLPSSLTSNEQVNVLGEPLDIPWLLEPQHQPSLSGQCEAQLYVVTEEERHVTLNNTMQGEPVIQYNPIAYPPELGTGVYYYTSHMGSAQERIIFRVESLNDDSPGKFTLGRGERIKVAPQKTLLGLAA